MREILFRGKRADNGEWVYGYLVVRKDGATYIVTSTIGTNRNIFINNMTATAHMVFADSIGQYTGLTDKNGKKIFEGDIVKCRHDFMCDTEDAEGKTPQYSYGKDFFPSEFGRVFFTYWRNYTVCFHDGLLRIQNKSVVHYIKKSYINNHQIEVIGNIHDNPELLKGAQE